MNIFLICLLMCVLFIACSSGEASESLIFSDDTTAAAQLVMDANEDLNRIKIKYKENETQREELKEAMKNNDVEKVRSIANDLNYLIVDGMALGESATGKIRQAQEMNINPDFKEYLHLKQLSLEKQMEAFENYRQAARYLRDGYDPKNEQQREAVKKEFTTREENFQKMMQSARDYSKQANDLAKESAKKANSEQ